MLIENKEKNCEDNLLKICNCFKLLQNSLMKSINISRANLKQNK